MNPAPLPAASTEPRAQRRAVCLRPGENPLFNVILAFWALWHCRHARPPDASLAA
ncbi:hypothetical protein [Pseudomonas sp. RIT-To-2]|uniref:hypothetical protein n=1 Tax=Pseudomonas sp. RIT-To-2 TaxID=3462541 RepID=UPI0024135B13